MVVDMNGITIVPGQKVRVHQDDGIKEAIVIQLFPDNPTKNATGHWVDINIDNRGPESMMSYVLEVI